MSRFPVCTQEDVAEVDCACQSLNGLREQVAQELDRDLLRLLTHIAGASLQAAGCPQDLRPAVTPPLPATGRAHGSAEGKRGDPWIAASS